MPFLNSLICIKGSDNGRRFLMINVACYSLIIIFQSILSQAAILVIILLIVSTPILLASAIRRLNDAKLSLFIAAIPVIIYLISLFGITYLEGLSRWSLLILATVSTLALSTISHAKIRKSHTYYFGYHGPVELKQPTKNTTSSSRIEPTIAGKHNQSQHPEINLQQEPLHSTKNLNIDDKLQWEQTLGLWVLANKKLAIIISSTLVILTVLFVLLADDSVEATTPQEPKDPLKKVFVKKRSNKIEMPDQFWIMLDQNDAMSIAWEGDFKSNSDLAEENSYWSAYTGLGDTDCINLHFSLGENIRTLSVTVNNGGDYYADFSPVDTATIIKSIADKDRFKLCGYEFTLKGTRSLLRSNKKYAEYLKD